VHATTQPSLAPNLGQVLLLIAAIVLFAAALGISLSRLRHERRWSRIAAKACTYFGVVLALIVLIWHAANRRSWLPLGDNFDAFIWLGLLLALFVLYVQRTHPIGGIDWFVLPIVMLLMLAAAIFGSARPHEYSRSAWRSVHYVTAYGGAVAFAVAGAMGAMYLLANRRVRVKDAAVLSGPSFSSLERLEHVTLVAVTTGFALLTVGAITGLVQMLFEHRATSPAKIVLTAMVWVIYGLVLHSPINPSFRGRKTALLSVLGFIAMAGVLVTVQLLPAK
jgi:ABC-type uncharacterized transport system permease subunit